MGAGHLHTPPLPPTFLFIFRPDEIVTGWIFRQKVYTNGDRKSWVGLSVQFNSIYICESNYEGFQSNHVLAYKRNWSEDDAKQRQPSRFDKSAPHPPKLPRPKSHQLNLNQVPVTSHQNCDAMIIEISFWLNAPHSRKRNPSSPSSSSVI